MLNIGGAFQTEKKYLHMTRLNLEGWGKNDACNIFDVLTNKMNS